MEPTPAKARPTFHPNPMNAPRLIDSVIRVKSGKVYGLAWGMNDSWQQIVECPEGLAFYGPVKREPRGERFSVKWTVGR